jgi:hypothetical protein
VNEHLETDSHCCGSDLASCDWNAGHRSRPTARRRGVIHQSGLLVVSVGHANLIKLSGAADVLTLSMRDAMIAAALSAPRSATAA